MPQLKCTVEVGKMQLDLLKSRFTDSSKVKTYKKSIQKLDSLAKVRQKDSEVRGEKYAIEAKARKEAKRKPKQ